MSGGQTALSLRWPIDLGLTVASHGWAYLAPWHWDPEAGRLGRHERIGDRLGTIAVTQRGPATMALVWQGFDATALPEIQKRVRRWLSADWEPALAMASLGEAAALIAQGGGRLLRGSSFYEDFRQDHPDNQHQLVVDLPHGGGPRRRAGRGRLSGPRCAARLW